MRRHDSVFATDQEALVTLLGIHAVPEHRILDVTSNRRRIWRGLPYQVHYSDVDPRWHAAGLADTVADFRALPFPDASFDVIVIDPPHRPDEGDGAFRDQEFGGQHMRGPNVASLFRPFLLEAKRVLVPDTGIVLAKIANIVHSCRYQDQARMFKNAAEELGMTHCDEALTIVYSRSAMKGARRRHVYHVDSVHCYWIVLRNGKGCMNQHGPRLAREVTGPLFEAIEAVAVA